MASLNKFHIPKERYFNNGFEQKETEVKILDLNNKNELKYRGFMRKYSFKVFFLFIKKVVIRHLNYF